MSGDMQSLKDLKKSLSGSGTKSGSSAKGSLYDRMCPKALKSSVGSLSKWQWRDIVMFTGAVVFMY